MYLFCLIVTLLFVVVLVQTQSSCPGASPNDNIPDDSELQECLNIGGIITLEPGTPGYIIAIGLNITSNGTTITSSSPPSLVTLLADPDLGLPILQTYGIIFNIELSYLLFDGQKDERAQQNQINCNGTDNYNYRTSNLMLPGYCEGGDFLTWNPEVFVENVEIHDITSINSPCGCGIGIQGKYFEIYNSTVKDNGWDTFNNPQNLSFPFADGINAAVCNYGYIHDNVIVDNTNMQVGAGSGPYCWVQNNVITQDQVVTQCGINCWPTNVWMVEPVWWHPEPWDLAHSSIEGNVLSSNNSVTAGAYSGIAVGGRPWANINLTNTGFIFNNTISGANVNLLVDGVYAGTIWANNVFGAEGAGGKTSSLCQTPQEYTVAESSNLFLQPGYTVYAFDQGRSCYATGENIESTIDDAKFVNWTINGVNMPSSLSGTQGAKWEVSITFLNSGSSIWQDIAGLNGYKVGDVINLQTNFWGTNRGYLNNEIYNPGQEVTYNFVITLPNSTGTYQFRWQMVQELVDWFGQMTPSIPITIQ
eukprot:Phypoly_transcript_05656.p1 GENE.Phypoly_transcript_05656~~Phypoly_transcript_05656.p1  ORF type:complete len:532 (+),score=60.94 Phypoly_transcript_05656:165-1760(+)